MLKLPRDGKVIAAVSECQTIILSPVAQMINQLIYVQSLECLNLEPFLCLHLSSIHSILFIIMKAVVHLPDFIIIAVMNTTLFTVHG